ncbi:glycerol-3-phosphate dehydrogenase/oxidase [Symbiobacterium terraclitae]|uniref:glycerol-3-phosphate dehydrogenase/oxidase n=1 Tax=Symbiobacterium terraclitae TaxID=557451 RepID=UPI0035B55940
MNRTEMIQRLASEPFDLLVVGGGITGAGVAREAALRGLKVGLVEANDFAYATSSRSTKLIHGGLRYLKNFEFRLVRESVVERQNLLFMAPHLVKATEFLFPVYEGDPDPLWMLHVGLTLYDWFAGRTNPIPHRMLKPGPLREREPWLRADRLQGGALYADCRTDDGRLTLEVIQSAAAHGAAVANYVKLTGFRKDGRGQIVGATVADQLSGEAFDVRASRVVAAAGPWADAVRRLDDPGAPSILRLTKGVHLVVPHRRLPIRHAVVMRGRDGRMMFAVPSGDCTYIGTTDTDHHGDPAAYSIARADVDYVVDAARRLFPEAGLSEEDIIAGWSGFRPLLKPENEANPSATSRDYKLFRTDSGLVTVGGGKLTAFRAMASHIVDDVFPATRSEAHLAASTALLPGAQGKLPDEQQKRRLAGEIGTAGSLIDRLADRYGTALAQVADEARAVSAPDPELRWRLAQARHAVKAEMAVHLLDVVQRRTDLMLFTPHNGRPYLPALADEMGALLGWSEAQKQAEIAATERELDAMFAWKRENGATAAG